MRKVLVAAVALALVAGAAVAVNSFQLTATVVSTDQYVYLADESMDRAVAVNVFPVGQTDQVKIYCVGFYDSRRCKNRLAAMDYFTFYGHVRFNVPLTDGTVVPTMLVVEYWN